MLLILIEKQQKEEIHKRFLSQNQIREKQIEEKRIQKRIDELKEKKFDNEFIANSSRREIVVACASVNS